MDIIIEEDRSDAQIATEIENRLRWDAWVDDRSIQVEVDEGAVILSGAVGSAAEKSRAYRDAWVSGVRSVDHSRLDVDWRLRDRMRPRRDNGRSNEKIQKAIEDALFYNPRVSPFEIDVEADHVEVGHGLVTLMGTVDNLKAKRSAEEDALGTMGVWWVRNLLEVHRRTTPASIGHRYVEGAVGGVRAALRRDPYLDEHRIVVSIGVHDPIVRLDGTVDSTFERSRAEDLASRALGVVDVLNNLEIDHPRRGESEQEIEAAIKDTI
jgi:osmotically-inducible protein OsmY